MMKRIFMLLALALMLVATMALSGVAQAASPKARCLQEATSLGVSLDGYNVIYGNNRANDFTSKATAGGDVFCGFGGNDSIATLDAGDIFLGGAGDDYVQDFQYNNGTFYGGAGNDHVFYNNGTFYGGDGNDSVTSFQDTTGTFNGGAGDDYVSSNQGTFNGDSGNDSVTYNFNFGTFNGGDGFDTIEDNRGGAFTSVESCSSSFDGGGGCLS
jgi:Ca2+-binding RTX toxin-like protein